MVSDSNYLRRQICCVLRSKWAQGRCQHVCACSDFI